MLKWLNSLDIKTQQRVEARMARLRTGNLGDHKYLQDGISELRFSFGSGFRVYYSKQGESILLLLHGGDKSSQKRDIEKAIQYLKIHQGEA
ncbi:MAG: type II toxin-antitoxin system RelE/ParE family toxin [bacterium]